jgi:hypothetical protein
MPSIRVFIIKLTNIENIQIECTLFLIYDTTYVHLEQQQSICIISKPWRVYCKLGMICKFLALSCNDTCLLCNIHKAFITTSVMFLQTAAKHLAQNRLWFPYYNYMFGENERFVCRYLLTFDVKSRSTACKHNFILRMGEEMLPANQSRLLILNTQIGLLSKNGNMHKECDKGNCRNVLLDKIQHSFLILLTVY